MPDIAPADYRLTVAGLAGRPTSFTLDDLKAMPGLRLEQAGVDEGRHAVAGIPSGHIRRIGGQEVADRRLVALVVEVVPLHLDVGIGGLKAGNQFFHGFLRGWVRLV